MNSKEALKKLSNDLGNYSPFQRKINIIKQDLDRLEKLEKVIELLKEYIELKSVLDFDTYLISLSKSNQDLLKEVFG